MMVQVGMNLEAAAGGVDRYFRGLLSGFDAIGVPYVAGAFGGENEAAPPPGERVPLGTAAQPLLGRWGVLRRFGQQAFALRPHLLVTHFALYAVPFLPLRGVVPHVIHFHGPWAGEARAEGARPWVVAAKRALERRVYRTGARFVVLSSAFRDLLAQEYGVPEERIRRVPGGVDLERFRPLPDRAALRRKWGWPEEGKVIFCVRRLARRMGLEALLEAFGTVRSRHPDAVLVIGGKGPLERELRTMAAPLGEAVRFTGFIPEAALPEAYAAADLTIVPSRTLEGFGLVTLESLAAGTPVLVTPVGGLPEAVRELDERLVLNGTDSAALARGMEDGLAGLLPDRAACRSFAERFGWPEIARRVNAVYAECREERP